MIQWLKNLYETPSDFSGDPAGWLGNQTAHALIVGGGLSGIFWWTGIGPVFVALIYGLWEFSQWRRGGGWLDCLTDWLFVVAGALLVQAGLTGEPVEFAKALVSITVAGLSGAWRRL